VKILARHEDDRLVVRNPFDVVGPSASEFKGRLHGLRTRVHRQDFAVAKTLGHSLFHRTELVVVERPRGERERLGLIHERLHDSADGYDLD